MELTHARKRPSSFNCTLPASRDQMRSAWIGLFDSSASIEARTAIRDAFESRFCEDRDHFLNSYRSYANGANPVLRYNTGDGLSSMQPGTIVAAIMASGFAKACDASAELEYLSIPHEHVLVGYSSAHRAAKTSSRGILTGDRMVHIPLRDLNVLRQNSDAPVLIVDNVMDSGLTAVTVGRALLHVLKHEGPLFFLSSNTPLDTWSRRVCASRHASEVAPGAISVVTEGQAQLSELQRI